jgi:hypothetical protein
MLCATAKSLACSESKLVSCFIFSASIANCFLASNLAKLVLAKINSPNPDGPTVVPSFLLASGLKLKILKVISSIAKSPSF